MDAPLKVAGVNTLSPGRRQTMGGGQALRMSNFIKTDIRVSLSSATGIPFRLPVANQKDSHALGYTAQSPTGPVSRPLLSTLSWPILSKWTGAGATASA